MSQRLKRWESPRKEGRNDKGKGGSARQRQKKKQLQMLRKKLKAGINPKTKRDDASVISFLYFTKASLRGLFLMRNHRNLLSEVCITNFLEISLTKNCIFKLIVLEL